MVDRKLRTRSYTFRHDLAPSKQNNDFAVGDNHNRCGNSHGGTWQMDQQTLRLNESIE
ncbi:hypothetical protein MIR68_002688 [Amoeboaphelidium protococcarum]|nr:hypothetical protein MIR68_002688 [Amoeboaphelidium protococcarum]